LTAKGKQLVDIHKKGDNSKKKVIKTELLTKTHAKVKKSLIENLLLFHREGERISPLAREVGGRNAVQ